MCAWECRLYVCALCVCAAHSRWDMQCVCRITLSTLPEEGAGGRIKETSERCIPVGGIGPSHCCIRRVTMHSPCILNHTRGLSGQTATLEELGIQDGLPLDPKAQIRQSFDGVSLGSGVDIYLQNVSSCFPMGRCPAVCLEWCEVRHQGFID